MHLCLPLRVPLLLLVLRLLLQNGPPPVPNSVGTETERGEPGFVVGDGDLGVEAAARVRAEVLARVRAQVHVLEQSEIVGK